MDILFDPVYLILDTKAMEQSMPGLFPDAGGARTEIWMQALRERERRPMDQITTDIYIGKYTSEMVRKAMNYWREQGLVKKIGPTPERYKYANILEVTKAEIPYNKSAAAVKEALDEKEVSVSDYVLARILSWRYEKNLRLPVVISVLKACLSISPVPDVAAIEQTVIRRLPENSGAAEAKGIVEEYYTDYTETQRLREILGKTGDAPEDYELEQYRKWKREWGFTREGIRKAAKKTAGGSPSFSYLDGILNKIHNTNKDDSVSMDELRDLLRQMGIPSRGIRENLSLYNAIRKEYSYEMICLAAQKTDTSAGALAALMDIYRRLEKWRKKGLTDREDIEDYMEAEERAKWILGQLQKDYGLRIDINEKTVSEVVKWIRDWRISEKDVTSIAEKIQVNDKPMRYLQKSIRNLHEERLQEIEDMISY